MTQAPKSPEEKIGVAIRYGLIVLVAVGGVGFGASKFLGNKGSAPVPGQQTSTLPQNIDGTAPAPAPAPVDLSATKQFLNGGSIRVSGSTSAVTQVKQIQAAAAENDVTLSFRMQGSGAGLQALKDGTADVAVVSEPVTDPTYEVTQIGTDTVVLFVSQLNTVGTLTKDQVQAIMTGKVTNWSSLTDKRFNAPIRVLQRRDGGTKKWFEHQFGTITAASDVLPDGSGEMFRVIERDRGAVGYGTRAHVESMVRPVSIVGVNTSRPIFAVTRKDSPDGIKAFVPFMAQHYNQ
jgi:phosphate transport system substrate-binding protein